MVRRIKLLTLLFCISVLPLQTFAQVKFEEVPVKAGFIKTFVTFTRWPKNSFSAENTPLEMCIIGEDPYSKIFNKLKNSKIQGRKLVVKRLAENAGKHLLSNCHILIALLDNRKSLTRVLSSVSELPILTISEQRNYKKQQSMINLISKNDQIVFSVNRDPANEVGIEFSARMLRYASKVIGGGQ